MIRERRRATDLEERRDILSLLLQARTEEGEELSDRELRDELLTLVLAGHETTANQLAWIWERLVRTPAAHDRLRDGVRGGDEALSARVVESTITEGMRSRPVIPIIGRRVMVPWRLGEYAVPADTPVTMSILLIHHREDVYPDPFAFRPERWDDDKPGTYTWIPFGGGIRRCLGAALAMAEQRVVLETMARRLDIAYVDPEPERAVHRNVTMIPSGGARVIVLKPTLKATSAAAASGAAKRSRRRPSRVSAVGVGLLVGLAAERGDRQQRVLLGGLDPPVAGDEAVDQRHPGDQAVLGHDAGGGSRPAARGSRRRATGPGCRTGRPGAAARACRPAGAARRAGRRARGRSPRRRRTPTRCERPRRPDAGARGPTTSACPARWPGRRRRGSGGSASVSDGSGTSTPSSHCSIDVWAAAPLWPHSPRGGTCTSATSARICWASARGSASGKRSASAAPSCAKVRGSASTSSRPAAASTSRSTSPHAPVGVGGAVDHRVDERAQQQRVARGDEVDRPAHEHDPDGLAAFEERRQLVRVEVRQPRPELEVRRLDVLGLQADELLDRLQRGRAARLQQPLTCQQRAVERAGRSRISGERGDRP